MDIKNVFVLILIAIYINQFKLCKQVGNLLEDKRCVYLISDQSDILDQMVFRFMQNSTIVSLDLSTFTNDSVKYYCTPTTYILIINKDNDIQTIVQDIMLLKVYTKLITVSHSGLKRNELKKLEEICYIRFIQIAHVVLTDNYTVKKIYVSEEDKNNLDRKTLKVLLFKYPPYVYRRDETWQGFEVRILKQIARDMSLEFVQYQDNEWVGEISDVGNNLADVSITGHWSSHILTYGGDPTVPYASVSLTFLVPRPGTLPVSTLVFQTLSFTVWMMIILSVLGFTVTLYLVHKCRKLKDSPTYLIIVLSYLSMVPVPLKSNYFLLRLQMILLAMTSVILSTMHSAGLSSIALVPRRYKAINTLFDLAESGLTCYAIEDYLKNLLLKSEFNSDRQIGLKMTIYDMVVPGACQEAVILKGNSLVPSHPSFPDVEQLMLLNDIAHDTYNCIALAKNSPYMKIFNERIYQLIEHGLIDKWISEEHVYLAPTKKYKGRGLQVGSREQTLMTIAKLQGAFYLLLTGYFISIGVFLIEFASKIKILPLLSSENFEYRLNE